MTFLLNTWYAAAWAGEVTQALLARTVLNEPLVLFRKTDGAVVALQDRCAHRFVPLHLGKLKGDILECKYHGLCYDEHGVCVFNPHGNGSIPPTARVKAYVTVEKHGAVWVWMGEAHAADPGKICDFSQFSDRTRYTCVTGYLHVAANYQLVADNLLDLTHGQYIHPLFTNPAGPATMEPDTAHEPDTVWAKFVRKNQYPNQYFQMLGFPRDQRGDHRNYMRWNPPGVLLLDVGMTRANGVAEEGISIPTAHLLTPETDMTTHYFWGMARNFRLDDQKLSGELLQVGMDIFENEDKPVIEAQQQAMRGADLFTLKPALLQTDRASVRARRMLAEKLKRQCSSAPTDEYEAGLP